jgi:hypothetical protein
LECHPDRSEASPQSLVREMWSFFGRQEEPRARNDTSIAISSSLPKRRYKTNVDASTSVPIEEFE